MEIAEVLVILHLPLQRNREEICPHEGSQLQDASVLSVIDIPSKVHNNESQVQYNSEVSVSEEDEFLQLLGATLEHTASQTNDVPITNMECQTEKEDCCLYCKDNNSMLREIMRHIKWTGNLVNSAPPEASMDTPSTLKIIFSPGTVDDTLVSVVFAEAETAFQLTVQTTGEATEATASGIDISDRNNANGSADYKPMLLLDFTELVETVPSTSDVFESPEQVHALHSIQIKARLITHVHRCVDGKCLQRLYNSTPITNAPWKTFNYGL
nr:PREDICTED: uncharacterized protein LOC106706098 [Latimeria chalumnae]|eukprot:XP_014351981.1 PREDICTED: uncharacterized protein LOC106706098 [Latimeria chalumnae]